MTHLLSEGFIDSFRYFFRTTKMYVIPGGLTVQMHVLKTWVGALIISLFLIV